MFPAARRQEACAAKARQGPTQEKLSLASVKLAPTALDDIERMMDFLLETDPPAAQQTRTLIVEALKVLAVHPFIGRPVTGNLRELVIFRGRTGYLARYSYRPERDEVLVTSVRHQREVSEDSP